MGAAKMRRRGVRGWLQSAGTAAALLEATADAILAVDSSAHIVLANSKAEILFGYSPAELVGQPLETLLPPGTRGAHCHAVAGFFSAPRQRAMGEGLNLTARRKDGSEFPADVSLSHISTREGVIAVASVQDITSRVRAERDLKKANETLQAIIRASPLAIIAADLNGRTTLWNHAAERIFGWTAEEVIGQPLPTVPAGQESELAELLALTASGSGLVNAERVRLRKDGSSVDVTVWTSPLRDADGTIRGFLSMAGDMSERKQLEAQLWRAQKLEALGRLAGGVAHDFNNLLTVIAGYTELALTALPQGPPRKDIEEIRRAGERAAQLTNQLLTFGRKQVSRPVTSDLNQVVREMLAMLRRTVGESCSLEAVLDPQPTWIVADPVQIEQVVVNLVLNARDAMNGGGRITIETARSLLDAEHDPAHLGVEAGPCVMLAVIDQGHGMNDEVRNRIFEPFFSTRERGTGLGLATVYGIVKQNNGEVWVESEPGFGTTFRIYFPAAEAASDNTAAAVPLSVEHAGQGSETILLVEDEDDVRRLVESMLARRGYTVLSAGSARGALQIAGEYEGEIDLLLSDVVMPGMNGIDLARGMSLMRPSTKVLFISGYANTPEYRSTSEEGAAFLQKPFTAEVLDRRMREVLGSPRDWPAPRSAVKRDRKQKPPDKRRLS